MRAQEIAQVIGDRIRPPEEQRSAALARARRTMASRRGAVDLAQAERRPPTEARLVRAALLSAGLLREIDDDP